MIFANEESVMSVKQSQSAFKPLNTKLNLNKVAMNVYDPQSAPQKFPKIGSSKRIVSLGQRSVTQIEHSPVKKEKYESKYTVKDPHEVFYRQLRERNKEKELHGPVQTGTKKFNDYDRVSQELKDRGHIPMGNKH